MVNKYLKGGKSEGMTLAQVAKLHNMNAEQLKHQLKKGIKHELEHTESVAEARRIALDHLVEFPDYYDRLDNIEKMHLGGDMSKHLAPNGKPSNLTHEQWHLVRTPKFKAWFGDWENDPKNASKVVDENGEPLVVHHGAIVETNFDIFDYQKADLGFHFGTKEQAKNRVESKGVLPKRKSIVNSFFLNIRVLFEMSDAGEWQYPQRYIDELISDNIIEEKVAKQKGFLSLYSREDNAIIRDYIKSKYGSSVGFVYNNKYEGKGKSFIALSPNEIKLADGSNTTFDGENPDIRFDKGGEIENLIDQGEIELKVYPTTPKHANLYGLKSENPLYIQTIFISENQRLKGIGKKVLKYLNDFAIENGHDVMFGHITQKASFSKDDSRESNLDDVAMIKNWLQSNGYEICEGNNDFYKVVNNPDIRFAKGGLIAPNGKPSNLTHQQWNLVRTPAFKSWFGDWENDPKNASKVVDENGEPLVVYHGTKKVFTSFYEKSYLGSQHQSLNYFTTSYKTSVDDYDGWIAYPCFLKIVYPLKDLIGTPEASITVEKNQGLKTDGFIYSGITLQKPLTDEETWLAVPKSNQIKLASQPIIKTKNKKIIEKANKLFRDGTNTTFDGNNPDIRFDKGGLIAPNGKKSNLTPEQYKLVRTREFKAWFGDWENDPKNASKVVDENGEPMVLWHYSRTLKDEVDKFYIFNVDKELGSHFGLLKQSQYLKYQSKDDSGLAIVNEEVSDFRYYQVFLNIRNPIRLKDVGVFKLDTLINAIGEENIEDNDWFYIHTYNEKSQDTNIDRAKYIAKSRFGYDGGVYLNRYESDAKVSLIMSLDEVSDKIFKMKIPSAEDSWIAFEPNQIKLADGTNTTFDSGNPDIRFDKGGRTIAQTPAPASDRRYGSKTNTKGSASDSQNAKSIKFNDALEKAIENKVDEYNEKHPSDKVSLSTAKAVVRRGMGAYSKSHRPTIGGGAPNSRQAWGLARLNKFLLKKAGVKVKSAYIQDDDLLKYEQGGEVVAKNKDIRGNLSNMDKEVKHTMGKAGGYLVGRRHSEGGIKAINKATGQPLEMEGGEVVITRNAVSDGTTREFEGEMLTNREILSRINQSGGGVSFEDGGEIMASGNQYNYGGRMMSDHDILSEMALGGELDEMGEMDEIEFEYGGDVTDFKLKNKIVFPTKGVEEFYYVNIFDNPEDLQIFRAEIYNKYSGRPVFKRFTKWSKLEFVAKTSYQYYNRKDFLTLIEPQDTSATYGSPRTFSQIPKKSMLIPRMQGTMAMYDRFTAILDNGLQSVPSQYNTDTRTKFEWLVSNRDFQNQILEFFNEYEALEPNFVYQEGVKKKVTRAKKEDKFQYGVKSLKFGSSYDIKAYNNKLVKNDGNNSLVDLISKIVREYYTTDINNPNAPFYEDRYLDIPVKELVTIQKNTGIEMSFDPRIGMRNLEMITSQPSRTLLLNKKQQYGVPKLIIDRVENLGGANILYYLFDKMGYQFYNDPTTWKKWFESGIIDFNIKLSIDDYCRVVGYLLARFCNENDFPIIRPIYNIDEEPMMIEDVKMVLDFDDFELKIYEGTIWYNWLMVSVLYYRANYVSQTSKAKGSMEVRIEQNLKVGDKVEISEQEMQIVGFQGRDENLDLLRGEVIGIRSVPAMKRPANPEGNMYTIRYFVPDKVGELKGEWEAKDLVLLEASDIVELEKPQEVQSKKPPVGKNKKPLGNKSELDKNIYDLQYLISITSDFDFEVKMKLRQQLTEFQKLKDIIYATENSQDLIKSSSANYDGKYAMAIIQTMLDADSVTLRDRPDFTPPYGDGFQPNGQETLLDKYNYELVQTPMFKEWFGDFISAYDFKGLSGYDNIVPVSKVMTEGYEPLVVYQGLGRAFERERFDSFPTSYFAVNPDYAEWFATIKGQRNATQGYVLPFFLNIRNPLDMTYFGIDKIEPKDFFDYLFVKTGQTAEQLGFDARFLQPNVPAMEVWAYIRNSPRAIEAIKAQGVYDGFHFYENNPQATGNQYQTEVWTTFFPNQTKLASNQRSKMLYSANQGFLMAKGGLIKK
jgi:hypothetical protein